MVSRDGGPSRLRVKNLGVQVFMGLQDFHMYLLEQGSMYREWSRGRAA